MSRASLLARGRVAAELGMVDTCTIRRKTGTTLDDFSGETTTTWDDLYTGKCRVQQRIAEAAIQDPGEDYRLQLRMILQLPITVVGLEVGDEITITASRDPDLVDRVLTVRDLMHKTDATARRVGVTEGTAS